MKKHLQLILVIVCLMSVKNIYAQNPVPNPGFENWTSGEPDSWTTSNITGLATNITQTSSSYSGASAVHGESILVPGIGNYPPTVTSTGSGFPVSQMYGTFSFYYKFFQDTMTSFILAAVDVSDAGGNSIATQPVIVPAPAASYTYISSPITYTGTGPANCIITFSIFDQAGLPPPGSTYDIDEVSLSGTAGLEEIQPLTTSIEKIQPNPVRDQATIYYSLLSNGNIQFELRDVTGKKCNEMLIANEIAGRHKMDFDVTGIPAGYYVLRMITSETIAVSTLIIR